MNDLGRTEAIEILQRQREQVLALVEQLSPGKMTRPGLGGGEWSIKDLMAHLESWEQHVLDALAAWQDNKGAPIDGRTWREGVNAVNAAELAARANRSLDEQLTSSAATHERLLAALGNISDGAWNQPPTSRARKTLGQRVGSILAGRRDPFTHEEAHLPDLRAWVEANPGS
jgi:hypothetical protein